MGEKNNTRFGIKFFKISIFLIVFILSHPEILYSQSWNWDQLSFSFGIQDFAVTPNGKLYITGDIPKINSEPGAYSVSADSGKTWETHSIKGNSYTSGKLLIKNNGHIFISCFKDFLGVLYRSKDEGISWDTIYTGSRIYSLAFNDKGFLFVGNGTGEILTSNDEGDTWVSRKICTYDISAIASNSFGDIYAGSSNGMFCSKDNGNNWIKIDFFGNNYIGNIFIDKYDRLYTGFSGQSYISSDFGKTWNVITNYNFASIVQLSDGRILTVQTDGIYITDSSLTSWKNIGKVFNSTKIIVYNSMAYSLCYSMIYSFDLKILNHSGKNFAPLSSGNKWQYISIVTNRYQTATYYKMTVDSVIADTSINNMKYFKMLLGNDAWYRYSEEDKKLYINAAGKDNLFMDFNLNDGSTFGQFNILDGNFYDVKLSVGNKSVFGKPVFYKSFNYIHFSTGFAGYSTGITYGEDFGPIFRSISYNSSGGISGSGGEYLVECIINNNGKSEKYYNNYLPQIEITPRNTTADSVFKHTLSVKHKYNYIFLHEYYGNNEVCFIDTVQLYGFYKKNDRIIDIKPQGANRKEFTTGYTFDFPLDMYLMKAGFSFYYKIYARDKGIIPTEKYSPDTGYYKLDYTPEPLSVKKAFKSESINELENCFPNPANNSARFIFTVPFEAFINITLYNSLGQAVKEIVNNYMIPGVYTAIINCDLLPSGIYYYRLNSGKYQIVKKMIILK